MGYELKFNISTNDKVEQKTGVPQFWFEKPVNEWWQSNDDISYFYSIMPDQGRIYLQYGQNKPKWASIKYMTMSINIINVIEHDDNSITVNGDVKVDYLGSKKTFYSGAGVSVRQWTKIFNTVIHEFFGNTAQEYYIYDIPSINFTEKILPQTYGNTMNVKTTRKYPNHEYSDSSVYAGLTVFNAFPLPPEYYTPMAIRKGVSWLDFWNNGGIIHKRQNLSMFSDHSLELFKDKRKENHGHNRIRKNGVYRQLPPMTGGETIL